MRIGVIGWGYVGAATGLGLKEQHEILVYDPFKDVNEFSINVMHELPDDKFMKCVTIVKNLSAMAAADVIFVCLPTPSNTDGSANLSYIENMMKELSQTLKGGILVIRSTVPPGTTARLQKQYKHFKFVHMPEFLRERTPLHDFLYPARIVVGGSDDAALQKVLDVFKTFECVKIKTDSTTSEMTKYASNCFLALKISYFNEIYNICKLVSADPKTVAEVVSMDERIGRYGIYGGQPFGGSCLPKDIKALIAFLEHEYKANPHMLKATKAVNDEIK